MLLAFDAGCAAGTAGRVCGRCSESTSRRLWPSFLSAPPYNYAFLSNPVVDPDFIERRDRLRSSTPSSVERSLPNVIRLRYLDGNSDTYPAIMNALAARGGQTLKLAERERPYVMQETSD